MVYSLDETTYSSNNYYFNPMQVRYFFPLGTLLTFCLLALFPGQTYSQTVSLNNEGVKIVVYPDGSWRYYNPSTDFDLPQELTNENKKSSTAKKNKKDKSKKEKVAKVPRPKKVKKNSNKVAKDSKSNKDKRKTNKVANKKKKPRPKSNKSKKDKLAKADKPARQKGKGGKKVKPTGKTKGKKGKMTYSEQEEERARALAVRRAEAAVAESAKNQRVYEDAVYSRMVLEDELKSAYSNLEMTDEDISDIETRLQRARANEEKSKKDYDDALELAQQYEKMVDMNIEKRDKALAKLNNPSGKPNKANEVAGSTAGEALKVGKKEKEIRSIREATDVMMHPPDPPCEYAVNEVDEFTGKLRVDLAKQTLFTYTNERMRPFLKGEDYIFCAGNLSYLTGGLVFLSLNIEISNEAAQRDYGYIEKGSMMTIKFIDGSSLKLYNKKTELGTVNPLEKSVVYTPQFPIDNADQKILKKGEIDKIRIVWSSGYEDYEVYEIDFFVNQFRCLDQK